MRIFVMGATGRVGQLLIADLVTQGHFIYAGARKIESLQKTAQIQPVSMDLHASVEELAEKLADSEAIYFVAGSRGKDLLQTDLFGAVKLMQAAEQKGIKRYIQLSSLFALQPERWTGAAMESLADYNVAKFFSDSWLMKNTTLDYTILQPGALVEKVGTEKIAVAVAEGGSNAISDVALTLAEVLNAKNTYKKVILMHEGETPIKEAIQSL